MGKLIKSLLKFVKNNFFLILAVLYVIWPIDIIPDFLGIIGGPIPFTDDGAVLFSALAVKLYQHYKNEGKNEKLEVKSEGSEAKSD